MTQLAESLWPACLSGLQLDRFLLGELPADAVAEVRAHLAGCALCSAQLERLRPAPLPPLRVVPLRPRLKVRWAAAAAGLAAAASVLVVVRASSDETRTKGTGYGLSMFVQHGGEVRRAGPGDALAAGDSVRFAVTAPSQSYVAVLSVDPRGHGSVYFPLGARAEAVPAGTDVALPLGTRLDATVGQERLLGIFCSSSIELEPIRAGLESGQTQLPEGCQVVRWSFEKK